MGYFKMHDASRFSAVIFFVLMILFLLAVNLAQANGLPDLDKDGAPDRDEIEIYFTDPGKFDIDGDGFSDGEELRNGFTPFDPRPLKLEESDYDKDGLSDRLEYNFGTNPTKPDTDNDGFFDGEEVNNGFDPLKGGGAKLPKKIEINLAKQELSYFLGKVRLGLYPVSSGAYNSTPQGNFQIGNKALKAWSPYGLWMPYWLGIAGKRFGIHELPIWPNGYREGAEHLGRPVSHGCIRLGIGPAKTLYDWAEVGTLVYIR